MTRKDLVGLGFLVGVGLVLSGLLRSSADRADSAASSSLAQELLQERSSPEVRYGRADLTLVVFTDYRCPACRKADPAMRQAVAKDGNVRIVYKDWPIFGAQSRRAALVALAAARQGIYASVHRALMASPNLDDTALRQAVEFSGGDWLQILSDLKQHREAFDRQLASNAVQAFGLGLQGTPGYLVGRLRLRGAQSEAQFLRAFASART